MSINGMGGILHYEEKQFKEALKYFLQLIHNIAIK